MKLKFSVGWRNHFPWHYWPGIVTDLFISTWFCMVTTGFSTCRIHYILACNKFAAYYFLETIENIPLIALEKKSLNIFLVLLSLPLQGCKSWCRQCNLNNIAFFFTFFKGYRCTSNFLWEPQKMNNKFYKNCENTGKILKITCHFVKFDIYFLGIP